MIGGLQAPALGDPRLDQLHLAGAQRRQAEGHAPHPGRGQTVFLSLAGQQRLQQGRWLPARPGGEDAVAPAVWPQRAGQGALVGRQVQPARRKTEAAGVARAAVAASEIRLGVTVLAGLTEHLGLHLGPADRAPQRRQAGRRRSLGRG